MKQMIAKDLTCLKDTKDESLEVSGDLQVSKEEKKIKLKNSLGKAS